MHSLKAKAILMNSKFIDQVKNLCGEVTAFDLTPAYSPFPVIAVAGGIPQRGQWRFSLGVACRETFEDAVTKAWLEWCQGVYFAGVYQENIGIESLSASDVATFDLHALYYSLNQDEWTALPFLENKTKLGKPSCLGKKVTPKNALHLLCTHLANENIELYYRELTTIDALQAGVHVVRAVSPQLIPIHAQHRWPFLGGTAANLNMRYPDYSDTTNFPNPHPHPLG
jgi:ribosomal protein S12 methylthiotransferase accessory factor